MCFCDNSIGKYGQVISAECNTTCGGITSQKCGGYLRSSIYLTEDQGLNLSICIIKISLISSFTFRFTNIEFILCRLLC